MSLAKSNARRARSHAEAMSMVPCGDVRAEAKRMLRLRGMTIGDLASKTGLGESCWKHRLCDRYRLTPGQLRQFLDAIDATQSEREYLSQLGARADGWEV